LIFGDIPFLIHPEILTSDEAIVGTLQHEVSELELLREFSSHRSGSAWTQVIMAGKSQRTARVIFTRKLGIWQIEPFAK
jgi:hypothetical protein